MDFNIKEKDHNPKPNLIHLSINRVNRNPTLWLITRPSFHNDLKSYLL
jgi:hypothetical protein